MILDANKLNELRTRDLPRMRAADVFTADASTDDGRRDADAALAAWDGYLAKFLKPSRECVCCGANLLGIRLGDTFIAMGGSFTWGIANGEGHCSHCRYPARAIHDLGDFGTISNLVLQYHPSELRAGEVAP